MVPFYLIIIIISLEIYVNKFIVLNTIFFPIALSFHLNGLIYLTIYRELHCQLFFASAKVTLRMELSPLQLFVAAKSWFVLCFNFVLLLSMRFKREEIIIWYSPEILT